MEEEGSSFNSENFLFIFFSLLSTTGSEVILDLNGRNDSIVERLSCIVTLA